MGSDHFLSDLVDQGTSREYEAFNYDLYVLLGHSRFHRSVNLADIS